MLPSSRYRAPVRDGWPHFGQTSITLDRLDRHFLRQPAALRVSLTASHVLVHAIDTFHDDLTRLVINFEHLAADPAVVAGNHFDRIV